MDQNLVYRLPKKKIVILKILKLESKKFLCKVFHCSKKCLGIQIFTIVDFNSFGVFVTPCIMHWEKFIDCQWSLNVGSIPAGEFQAENHGILDYMEVV